MWRAVELRELRLLLTIGEELHFGRTAERLRLTPSRASQVLRDLERKLGVQLVYRTSRQVRLTPAGQSLLDQVRPVYEGVMGVLERTHENAGGLEGSLRLGLLSGPAGGPRLLELIGAFEVLHPQCRIDVVQMSWDDPFGRLRENDVDVIATWIPLEEPDLVVGPVLTTEPRLLAVAHDHPFAERESVDVEELAECKVVRFENWPRELHEAVFPSTTPGGRSIPTLRLPPGERAVLDISLRVARGEVVHPTVASAAAYMGELDLMFIPISGMKPLRSALVWRRPARDPKLRAFTRVARDVLKS